MIPYGLVQRYLEVSYSWFKQWQLDRTFRETRLWRRPKAARGSAYVVGAANRGDSAGS
jgi:hypothetical protein